MSDEHFPGFLDDQPKPPAPAKPAAPKPAFDPFAAPATKAAPGSPAPAPGFDPFAGVAVDPKAPSSPKPAAAAAQPAPAADEADITPGMAKDLWPCPHCGTKNKPQRESCRQCGKRPSDPIEIPWHQPLGVRLGLAAGALALVALAGWLLIGAPIGLVPADVAHIDRAPRVGGSAGPEIQLDGGHTFVPRKRFAVCGRVLLTATASQGLISVVLALGDDGRSADVAETTTVELSASGVTTTPERRVVLINAFGDVPALTKGAIVSLLGEVGGFQGETEVPPGEIVRIIQSH